MSAARVMDRPRTQSNLAIRHRIEGLNREDSEFRPHLWDATLVGLRLSRNLSLMRCATTPPKSGASSHPTSRRKTR